MVHKVHKHFEMSDFAIVRAYLEIAFIEFNFINNQTATVAIFS